MPRIGQGWTKKSKKLVSEGVRNYWASMTPEQRSVEMKRRAQLRIDRAIARRSGSRSSPFPKSVYKPRSNFTIQELLTQISDAVADLKTIFGQ